MRYFYVITAPEVPQRFWKITEISEKSVTTYKNLEYPHGYVKEVENKDVLKDKLLLQHFTKEQLK